MSRAPVNETPTVTTINAAMSPFGVIDFVDNQCGMGAAAAPGVAGSVVGGPPAYLDAHGIRYVPSGALEAADACPEDPADLQKSLVSMGRSASSEPAPVSQRELNSRVDDRIRRFMSKRGELSDLRDEIRATRMQSEERLADLQGLRDMDFSERRERLESIRSAHGPARRYGDEDFAEPRSYRGGAPARRAYRDDASAPRAYRDDASAPRAYRDDASAPRAYRDEDEDLRELHQQMQADVARARLMSEAGGGLRGGLQPSAGARVAGGSGVAQPTAPMRAGSSAAEHKTAATRGPVNSVPGARVLSREAAARVSKAKQGMQGRSSIDF